MSLGGNGSVCAILAGVILGGLGCRWTRSGRWRSSQDPVALGNWGFVGTAQSQHDGTAGGDTAEDQGHGQRGEALV